MIAPTPYAWLIAVHGHLAVLGLAVLTHPIVTLRLRKAVARNTLLTAELAAILLAAPFALGWLAYPTYRRMVKPALYLAHPDAVLRFESKEHLAVFAVAMVVAGAGTLRLAGRHPAGKDAAWILLACGWVLGLVAAGLGLAVHGLAHPGW